jgi:lipid-binding SYLF domain-containing protein
MKRSSALLLSVMLLLCTVDAAADSYSDTVTMFKNAGQSAAFFQNCYGYAVFPTIGRGGLVVGMSHGTGRVFLHDQYVGNASVTQWSFGLQAGGQAYSQIIFFEDQRAFNELTSGNLEFGADAGAVAITAAAGASAGTSGMNTNASGGKNDATTAGGYQKGLAVFTIVKGGAMFQATVAGQKFKYTAAAGTAVPAPASTAAPGSPAPSH